MNAHANFSAALKNDVSFVSEDELFMPVTSNVARDALKRASDFKSIVDCVYETISNAYESYDVGQEARVEVEIRNKGKDSAVIIRDSGVGMCSKVGLPRFFSLHQETQRRPNGLNSRGNHGTGKIAPFKYGERMQIETVKAGLRNILVLTSDVLEYAAKEEIQPKAQWLVKDQPTTDPSGTTVTVTKIKKNVKFNADFIRSLRNKIAFEGMMWMKNGIIEVNGEVVPPQEIAYTSREEVTSECGNFTCKIYYREGLPYQQELPAVFMNVGRVFVAREQFGMEGRKSRMHVHVQTGTSEAWAKEHFDGRRERFVSESRDLKLKLDSPEAQAYVAFVTEAVSMFMDKLDEAEAHRRLQNLDDYQKNIEKKLSKAFSNLLKVIGGPKPKPGQKRKESNPDEGTRERRQPSENSKAGDGQKETNMACIEFAELDEALPYVVDFESRHIRINQNFGTLKALRGKAEANSHLYAMASAEVSADAFSDLVTHVEAEQAFADRNPSIFEVLEFQRECSAKVREASLRLMVELYTNAERALDKAAA